MDTNNIEGEMDTNNIENEMDYEDFSNIEDGDYEESENNAMSDDDDNDDSSTSSDDDDDDDEEEAAKEPIDIVELEKTIADVKQQLQASPYYYDPHVQLISCLKKLKDKARLNEARLAMYSLFPLTEDLWLDWIKDEEDRSKKLELIEKALEDYDSSKIWLELMCHHISNGPSKVREVSEKALTRLGLHGSEGSLIWSVYRDYETSLLKEMQPLGMMVTGDQEKLLSEQIARIADLYSRQLSLPLNDLESTFKEYEEWTDTVDPQITKNYELSLKKLKTFHHFEDNLFESKSLQNYNNYIEHALAEFEPNHMICIFERAIKDHPIEFDVWIKYLSYLNQNNKVPSVVLGAYTRAIRNCSWCLDIWLGYLRALESFDVGHERIRTAFNDSLLVGFSEAHQYLSLWTTYIDYLRRRVKDWSKIDDNPELEDLREAFNNANNQLFQTFSIHGDPNCSLQQYQAFIEAKFCKNMSKARELFSSIMQDGLGSQATLWLQYAQLERSYGDVKHCRKVFQKAINFDTDWPEYVTEAFVKFEREEGDLQHFLEAQERCRVQVQKFEERKVKDAQKYPTRIEKGNPKKFEKNKFKKNTSKASDGEKSTEKFQKNKTGKQLNNDNHDGTKQTKGGVKNDTQVKVKPYTKKDISIETKKSDTVMDNDGFKVPNLPKSAAPPPGYKRKSDCLNADKSESALSAKKLKLEENTNPVESSAPVETHSGLNTIFVSNLDYLVTKEEVEKIFSEIGTIKEVRLVVNDNGKSRGYGYVEFDDELCALKALNLDRKPIGKRPMFVSKYKSKDAKESKLKFSTGFEKNKLFLKNLKYDTKKETLEELFKTVGPLKEVRIVTHKSGKSKGIAYVEFQDEASAAQAILKFNGHLVDGFAISVDFSNPPPKNIKSGEKDACLGGSKKDRTGRKSKISIPMVPRILLKQTKNEDERVEHSETRNMSNSDFRETLLPKKTAGQ